MRLKQIKTNLWHKYILYYCIIFIIPFIILSSYIFKFSLEKVKSEFDNNIMINLEQSKKMLIEQIEKLQNISSNISKDSYISPIKMEHEYYSSLGKDMILKYVNSEPILEDIIISYFSQNDKYYSSKGAYNSIDVLAKEYYKNIDVKGNTFRNIFKLKKPQIILLSEYNQEERKLNLSYIFPLYDESGIQYGTTTFLLNEEKLSNILPEFNSKNKNELYIINDTNHILLSNNENLNNRIIDNKGKMLSTVLEDSTYDIDGIKYRILTSELEELGLKFVNISSNSELITLLLNSAQIALKLLISVFLSGLISILVISYFQYLPIKRIYEELLNKRKNYIYNKNEDELKNIEKLIKDIISQNEELTIKNENIANIDENKLLLELIEGSNDENKEKHSFILDLENRGKGYYILLLKKSQLSKESKNIMHEVLPIKNTDYEAFMIQIPLQDKVGILVMHNNEKIEIENSLISIENKLCNLEYEVHFYCGSMYKNLYEMNQSYIEAMIASDYIIDYKNEKYIYYKESDYSEQEIKYPYDIEEKLAYGIKQGAYDVVIDSLNHIFEFMNCNKHHNNEIKVYSFYLINFIIKTAYQVDYPKNKININELVSYKNSKQFKESVYNLVEDVNKYVFYKREKVRDTFKENILNDINKNYRSHDLSLELLSQKYDYSVPYLSKMIKEETGMTFTKYIQELRFEYIKEQLQNTNLPIKEIVFEAGYYDLSNFSRKFKTIMGVTPGQYREINKAKLNLELI